MAKHAQKNGSEFALQFIGSILFLAVVAALYGSAYANGNWTGQVGFWTPLVYSLAVISSIVLFFTSFTNLSEWGRSAAKSAMSSAIFGGFALITLAAGNAVLLLITIVGFILAFIGGGLACKRMNQ
jgi:hypothetical protein